MGYEVGKGGKDGKDVVCDFSVMNEKSWSLDERWSGVWGEKKCMGNDYNDMVVELKENCRESYMKVGLGVYEDGVGLGYELGEKGNVK